MDALPRPVYEDRGREGTPPRGMGAVSPCRSARDP